MADTPAWNDADLAGNPHDAADKAKRVEHMFACIARSYDLNNRVHSLWRDQAWRRAAVRLTQPRPDDVVFDVACGTGDLAMAFAKAGVGRVLGLDFTVNMLKVAETKASADAGANTSTKAPPVYAAADAMNLPVVDASADVVSIAFGIRNVATPAQALREFYRALRPGGRLVILEFSLPSNAICRSAYLFYFNHILPRTASLIARDRSGAYRYLPRSVNTFLSREQLIGMMQAAGFGDVTATPLTFGIAVAYVGHKAR